MNFKNKLIILLKIQYETGRRAHKLIKIICESSYSYGDNKLDIMERLSFTENRAIKYLAALRQLAGFESNFKCVKRKVQ